jgi:hypothetical protein
LDYDIGLLDTYYLASCNIGVRVAAVGGAIVLKRTTSSLARQLFKKQIIITIL